jgi:cell division protein FtsB
VNVNLGIWSKLTKAAMALVIVAILLLVGMCYLPVIQQNQRMRSDILRLQNELQKEQARVNELQAQINALQNDPNAIARLAREKLGYAKPGETVVRFEQPATNTSARQ